MFETIADRRRRPAHSDEGRHLVALQDQQRLSMVSLGRALELRAGQILAAARRAARSTSPPTRPRRFRAPFAGAGTGSISNPPTGRRPASPSMSAGAARRAPTRPTMSSSRSTRPPTRPARRPSCASPRSRRARRRSRWSATASRSSSTSISSPATTRSSFEVGGDWGAGAYAVALTHRALDVAEKRMPGRAIGVAWFRIDETQHKLDVSIRRAGNRASARDR